MFLLYADLTSVIFQNFSPTHVNLAPVKPHFWPVFSCTSFFASSHGNLVRIESCGLSCIWYAAYLLISLKNLDAHRNAYASQKMNFAYLVPMKWVRAFAEFNNPENPRIQPNHGPRIKCVHLWKSREFLYDKCWPCSGIDHLYIQVWIF